MAAPSGDVRNPPFLFPPLDQGAPICGDELDRDQCGDDPDRLDGGVSHQGGWRREDKGMILFEGRVSYGRR